MPTENELPTVNIPAVEIFSEGTWNGDQYDAKDLQEIVDAFDKVGFEPTAKAGHADGQDEEAQARRVFGAPALGYVSKVYRQGTKLMADFKQVPRRFANLIKAGAYKRVSSEIYWNYKDSASNKTYPRVLKSVAFLGAEIPALTNLSAVEALYHKKGERVFAYESGREYRVYDMMPAKSGCTVGKNGDKYCVYGPDGKKMSEHDSQADAQKECDMQNSKNYADYPWEQCIKDQLDKGEDEESAKKICGSIKAKYNSQSQGAIQMTEQEIQAKLDEVKAELVKGYEAKLNEAVTAAESKAKTEGEAEKAKLVERIALLERQNADAVEEARATKIDQRLDGLKREGKITPVEETKLKAIFRALPDLAVHAYSENGAEVKEKVVDTIWKIFESRNTKLFNELAAQGSETSVRPYANVQDEINRLANEEIAKNEKLSIFQAYKLVQKSQPELWRKYEEARVSKSVQ